jgi:rhodanese-related sulfurtransferase
MQLAGESGMFDLFKRPPSRHRELVREGALLLDVRTAEEFASGHVDGAINIPVDRLPARLAEIGARKKVVVYCRSGGRSARAAALLRSVGHEVHDIGGMSSW